MCSIFEQLGLIADTEVFIPFDIWFKHYKNDIINIFAFFKEELHDVHPFSEKLKILDNDKTLKKFAKFIYKSSSKVLS